MQKPTKEELAAAPGRSVKDVIAPGLTVLFCGINPGLWSGATGFHFAKPGNRFWKVLHLSGFTPRLFSPDEQEQLLTYGFGITNVATRTTARADELSKQEILEGRKKLIEKVLDYKPRYLAVLGIGTFRTAFANPDAKIGLQEKTIGETRIWLLPNPSGLNAHYQLSDLTRLFARLYDQVKR